MRKTIVIVLFCMFLCGTTHAAQSFEWWFPWIYRYCNVAKTNVACTDGAFAVSQDNHNVWLSIGTNNPGSNAWAWVQSNSNAIYYMYSRTDDWNQAVIDSSSWTNWAASYTSCVAYMCSRTDEWNQAVIDSASWTNWASTHTAGVDYVFGRTSLWNQASVDASFATNWIAAWSGVVAYVNMFTNEFVTWSNVVHAVQPYTNQLAGWSNTIVFVNGYTNQFDNFSNAWAWITSNSNRVRQGTYNVFVPDMTNAVFNYRLSEDALYARTITNVWARGTDQFVFDIIKGNKTNAIGNYSVIYTGIVVTGGSYTNIGGLSLSVAVGECSGFRWTNGTPTNAQMCMNYVY